MTHFTLNGNQERPTIKKFLKIPNVLIKRAMLQFKTVNLQDYLKIPPFEIEQITIEEHTILLNLTSF